MEQRHRKRIDKFCDKFSSLINMETLWTRLITNKVFNRDDVVSTWQEKLTDPKTVRDILYTIKTQGSCAFGNLILSLCESDQLIYANILRNELDFPSLEITNNDNKSNDTFRDDNFHNTFQLDHVPLEVNVKKSTKFRVGPQYDPTGVYRMQSEPRGYVLIFTNISYKSEERDSAEYDEINLKKLFTDLGFGVTSKINLTGAQMKRTIADFSHRDFHSVDSLFVIMSGHGAEGCNNGRLDTEIIGIDYKNPHSEKLFCNDVVKYFLGDNCPELIGKPKIFIFQACRGERVQNVTTVASNNIVDGSTDPNCSDTLIAHSTRPGYVAYRSTYCGSWFIQILCEVFMNYACTMHILDLFNMVRARMMTLRTPDNESQTLVVKTIGFNKLCYLNPGDYKGAQVDIRVDKRPEYYHTLGQIYPPDFQKWWRCEKYKSEWDPKIKKQTLNILK